MKTAALILNNEEGYVIVIAILILALLTIIGTSATQTTTVELQIVRNDLVYKEHLYRAEAAAIEAAQWLQNAVDTTLEDISTTAFISQSDVVLTALDLNDGTWGMSAADPDQNAGAILTGYRIVDETGPVDLGAESNLHTYTIYGFFNRPSGIDSGEVLIAIGYKKRF